MSTSIIQQKVTDPEFEDSTYQYQASDYSTTNTFPSNPTISNYMYTFSVAKSGYKAVGVVSYSIGNSFIDITSKSGNYCSFDYSNQTVSLYFRGSASSTHPTREVYISAKIKYLKL